jgi:3-methyladenine DNA glycosylase AlkD
VGKAGSLGRGRWVHASSIRESHMTSNAHSSSAKAVAADIDARLRSLPAQDTPHVRAVRRSFSRVLKGAPGAFILEVARELRRTFGYRNVPYELIRSHAAAYGLIGEAELEELGQGLDSWWSVDGFARTLSGPAWRDRHIDDRVVLKWARSQDKWWRRAALVSTVALNVRSQGGKGDVARTLGVCRLLVDDHDDMVEKAMSWALRELVPHDASAVDAFLSRHEDRLGSRVKREVRNKLKTGLKTPARKRGR